MFVDPVRMGTPKLAELRPWIPIDDDYGSCGPFYFFSPEKLKIVGDLLAAVAEAI